MEKGTEMETQKDIEFQAFAWEVGDCESEDLTEREFGVRVFGKTRDGQSVSLHVKGPQEGSGYRPSFCISVPAQIGRAHV